MSDIEIELKFPLKNPEEVISFLESNADKDGGALYQKDTYYTPTHRNFMAPQFPYEWLRLRETETRAELNYKHFYPEGAKRTDYCDEFESEVADIDQIQKILSALNMTEIAIVEKHRNVWLYEGAEFAIDTVIDLGTFIEVEAKELSGDARKVKKTLRALLTRTGAELGEEELRGYPYLLLKKNGSLKN